MNEYNNEKTVEFSKIDKFIKENNEYNKINVKIKKNKNSIYIIILISFLFISAIFCFGGFIYYSLEEQVNVKNVELINYNEETKVATLKITLNDTLFNNKRYCYINEKVAVNDNSCLITTTTNNNKIEILNDFNLKKEIYITDYINKALVFEMPDKIYLAKGDTYQLNIVVDSFSDDKLSFKTSNDVVTVSEDFLITGKKDGKAKLSIKYLNELKEMEVVVSSLIVEPPKHFNYKKSYLTCNRYTKSEADLLDEILEFRINTAGYETRAGVVAAARFLSLEFPYRIDYFFENGRVSDTGVHYADGEGRYYHKGLYLHSSKFSSITKTFAGPAIWGCPLMNFEDVLIWKPNTRMPNGLDCSGFVTWTLLNGGFDVGDIGAGETPEPNQLTDVGERVKVTKELMESGKVKPGDLINWWGHIGIIIGIDEKETYYVAESLDAYYGLVVKEYKKSEMPDSWTYIMLMDDVYKEDGNLTNMWY